MRIAIIGFGFSGLMVAANLVRGAVSPLTLYIIAADLNGLGVAYATQNPEHLLNVPAAKMGAFADEIGGFHDWLATADAAIAKRGLGITRDYDAADFAPRALYGAYLQSIWRETQEIAAHKKLEIKLVPSDAMAVQAGEVPAVLTERGDAIAADAIVLATGNETRPVAAAVRSPHIIQNPWAENSLRDAASWSSPVMLIGTGLTAVDTVLSLRDAGYRGEIIACSRNGRLPQPHRARESIFAFAAEQIAAHKTLPQLLRMVRKTMAVQGDWRAVLDALRPHIQRLWQGLTTREQQRFLTRLMPLWNTHRHRMAPEIAARIEHQITAGTLRIIATKKLDVHDDEGALSAAFSIPDGNAERSNIAPVGCHPSRILNCIGPELNPAQSKNVLLRQLLAEMFIEPHATGLGIATDMQYRAWGNLHPKLFAMGALMTGQLLESTAVPELRAQAQQIAHTILSSAH